MRGSAQCPPMVQMHLTLHRNPTQNSINNHVQQPYSATQDMHESCSHASPRIPYDIEQQIQTMRHPPDIHH